MKNIYYFTMEELIKVLYRATMKEAKHEKMLTKSGATIEMICLPLDRIRRVDD